MIISIGLLLEELSVLLCIHYLYGEKFRLDIYTTSYLTVYMIIISAINYYKLPGTLSLVTYLLIALYCGIKFGFNLNRIIINNILYMVIVGVIQLVIMVGYGGIIHVLSLNRLNFSDKELLIANLSLFIIVIIILPRFGIKRLSIYLQNKERILTIFLFCSIVAIITTFTNYKLFKKLEVYEYIIIFSSIGLFFILAAKLGKYKIKSKEIETELKMQKLYTDSFCNLIEEIRMRQHEFDNHISALYSLHYTCDSYEQLVKAQNEYSQVVTKENRYNKLLKAGNPLLIGFLYGKFIEIDKLGILLSYQVNIENLNIGVPVYKLVEILGNLIKNAVEAMENLEYRALHVMVIEADGKFEIEVRNISEFIDYSQIEKFFKKGYSKKGKNRGLGLFNVKVICNEYLLNILCENRTYNDKKWFCFNINNEGAI